MAKRSKRKKAHHASLSEKPSVKKAALSLHRDWMWGLLLATAIILVYLPIWRAGFIWDDDLMVTDNPCIIGPFGLKEIWTTNAADICPLTLTTFWVEHALWGLAPLPYHLVNVLLHIGCALVLWHVLRVLQIPGAWLGAALWSLHPVQVESVAWIAETKNAQSALFYLLSVRFFVRSLKSKAGWDYGFVLLFAALAMTSKASTVVLPAMLCLCAWWTGGGQLARGVMRTIPVFLMAAFVSSFSIWTQKINGAADPYWIRTWPEKFVIAGEAVWFYLGKIVWPYPLMVIYPRWPVDARQWFSYLPFLAVVGVFGFLWWKRGSWARPYLTAWTYFLVALLPILGFVEMTFQHQAFVADHFQYLADMGPLALAGAGIARFADQVPATRRWISSALITGLLMVLGILSWQRVRVYENTQTLWTDTLAKNPASWAAHNNLGVLLLNKGRVPEAIAQIKKALEVDPEYSAGHDNLGNAYIKNNQVNLAISEYRRALQIDPHFADAHVDLGDALQQIQQPEQAKEEYQKALSIDLNDARAHVGLGNLLVQEKRPDEAMLEFQNALRNKSNDSRLHYGLGLALYKMGKIDEAVAQYNLGLSLEPNYAEGRNDLGNALLQQGRIEEAIQQFRSAIEIEPTLVNAHYNLALALSEQGHGDDAIQEYKKALEINPQYAEAHNNLGYAYLQQGRMDAATAEFQAALKLLPTYAEAYNNLGIVFAQKGQLPEAIEQFEKALQMNPALQSAQDNLVKARAAQARHGVSK